MRPFNKRGVQSLSALEDKSSLHLRALHIPMENPETVAHRSVERISKILKERRRQEFKATDSA